MEFHISTENSWQEYQNFVAAHPSGSFLQSWQWGEWQEQQGHEVIRCTVKQDDVIILTAQVIKITIPRLKRYYLYIPYGPLITKNNNETLAFFTQQLKQKFPKTVFIRFEPKDILALRGKPTQHIQPGKTLVVNLQQTAEDLLAEMHPKTRYNIKVAARHGVSIVSEPIITPGQGLRLQQTVDLLVTTAKRQDFKNYPADYFKKFINFFTLQTETLACQATIYQALHEDQLLATAIMLDFSHTRIYLFGGTSDQRRDVMAPYALHWQAMNDAKQQGKTHYDFWGIETNGGKAPGFVRFKLGWGGQEIIYPAAFDIVERPLWYTVYKKLRALYRKI